MMEVVTKLPPLKTIPTPPLIERQPVVYGPEQVNLKPCFELAALMPELRLTEEEIEFIKIVAGDNKRWNTAVQCWGNLLYQHINSATKIEDVPSWRQLPIRKWATYLIALKYWRTQNGGTDTKPSKFGRRGPR